MIDQESVMETVFGMLAEDLAKPLTAVEQMCVNQILRMRQNKNHNRRWRRRFWFWEKIYAESRFSE